jgi:hypothetical protein
MYTPARSQRFTPNSLSPSDSTPHTTPASEYSQSSHRSPSDANIDRPGSTTSQMAEHLPLFDPYYRQYHGPGINTGTHLSHHSAPVSCHAQPYPSSIDTAYNWQGDGAGSGYRALYSPQTRSGGSGGSSVDQSTESLHVSIAQIMAEMKGVAVHVTNLCKRQAELDERMNQILTHIEGTSNCWVVSSCIWVLLKNAAMSGGGGRTTEWANSPSTRASMVGCIECESVRHRPRHVGGSTAFETEYKEMG